MTTKYLDGFQVRSATIEDADMIVAMINDAALVDAGTLDTNRDDKITEWSLPQFRMEQDTLLVVSADGRAAGYGELWDSEPHVRHYMWCRVHPEFRGVGIGLHLADWAETRARRSLDKAPQGTRVSLHTSTLHENGAAKELFALRGFSLSRHFFQMLAEMVPDDPPPAPFWPEGIAVRPFELGQDGQAAHQVVEEAFRDHWGYVEGETFEEWVHWIANDAKFDASVCFLAMDKSHNPPRLVGALMSRPEWEKDSSVAWIDELAVLRPWRRKGIGLALLRHAFAEYHRRARYKVGLGVDAGSLTGALRLYEMAGMRCMRQLDAYEKVLRPGRDLSTQSLQGSTDEPIQSKA